MNSLWFKNKTISHSHAKQNAYIIKTGPVNKRPREKNVRQILKLYASMGELIYVEAVPRYCEQRCTLTDTECCEGFEALHPTDPEV